MQDDSLTRGCLQAFAVKSILNWRLMPHIVIFNTNPAFTQIERIIMMANAIDEILHQKRGELYTISPDATVFDAIELMADKNIGALIVMSDHRLVGVVSERDYTRKVALKGKSSRDTRVRKSSAHRSSPLRPHTRSSSACV